MPIIHRWPRGATWVARTTVTDGNRPVCTAGKPQWSCPTTRGSKNFNGLTGSPKFSCLGADSDPRSPQVHPTAVQPPIALGTLSAGNSPGLWWAWYFPLCQRKSSRKAACRRALPSALEALPTVFRRPGHDSCSFSGLSFFAWCDFKNIL